MDLFFSRLTPDLKKSKTSSMGEDEDNGIGGMNLNDIEEVKNKYFGKKKMVGNGTVLPDDILFIDFFFSISVFWY